MFDRKEYDKKRYRKNKEKISKQHKEWRKANPEYSKEYMRKWREANPKCDKKYRKENKEYQKEYKKQWLENNSEKEKKYHKKYYKTEKGKATTQRSHVTRRTREKDIINNLTSEEWQDILNQYDFKCAYCGKNLLDLFDKATRDHVIPISIDGNNVKENIVPACKHCNSKKGNKILGIDIK